MRKFLIALILLFIPLFCFTGINYLHIPKCGGTTIQFLLSENFKKEELYPYLLVKKDMEMPLIDDKVTMGHFPYWFLVEKDLNFKSSFTFTILREPVERVISHYFYFKNVNPNKELNQIPKNSLCYFLCSNQHLYGESLLQDAISNLKTLDFVFFMDDYEDGIRKLFKRLNLKLPDPIPHLNITKKLPFNNDILKQIAEENALDVQLYDYAKSHYKDNKIY